MLSNESGIRPHEILGPRAEEALINQTLPVGSNSFPFQSIVFEPHRSLGRKDAFASLHIMLLLLLLPVPNDASQLDNGEDEQRRGLHPSCRSTRLFIGIWDVLQQTNGLCGKVRIINPQHVLQLHERQNTYSSLSAMVNGFVITVI